MNTEIKQTGSRKHFSKAVKIIFLLFFVFVVSASGSILSDKYIFPWLATRSFSEKYKIFKKGMENVTVINKTEQVTMSENQTISGFTNKSAASVVEIVSRQPGSKTAVPSLAESRSGMIVTADGLIASFGGKFFEGKDSEYKVFLQDGKSFDAKVVVRDSFSDLVLMKMEGVQNLPAIEFIAPEDIKIGMKTAVAGRSGFNGEASLRTGITSEWEKISSISGPLASSEKLQGVLYLDSSLASPRDDNLVGGATVDFNGNVIGILGEKKEDAGTRFFVVPMNHLQYLISQYLEKGRIERANLGVYYISLSEETAFLSGSNLERGALVYSASGQQGLAVISGSPADQAGIKIGDILLSVNGEEINPNQNLSYLISKYKPGDAVTLKISRDGKEMELKVILQ
jgi:serine protease Do